MKIRDTFLPLSSPVLGEEEIAEVVDTIRSNWLTTGPKTKRFEAEFSAFTGASAALGVNSCTSALHCALVAMGIGAGDEVITTPLTFAATANVIEHVGARPVFVDVDPETLNLDVDKIERSLTLKTKAILPVHLAGHPVELDSLAALAKARRLLLLEDAAHAVGAEYKGRKIGSGENPAAFSFHTTKNMTTADGGMLTGPSAFVDKARVPSLHGMSNDGWKRYEQGGAWFYEILMPGFKYNMNDIQASFGLAQLKKLPGFQARRTAIAHAYTAAFSGEPALQVPADRGHVVHAWHLYILRLSLAALTISRDRFIDELRARRVGTSVHFIPMHLHPYYRDKYRFRPAALPVAVAEYERFMSLPLGAGMTDEDVGYVIEAVKDIIAKFRA